MSQPILGSFPTFTNPTPGGSTSTTAHTQDSGSDRGLLVSITLGSSISVLSVTYNGVAMTEISTGVATGISQRFHTFFLEDPATGTNNIVVTYSANQWSPISLAAYSFTNCGGSGDTDIVLVAADPATMSLSCSDDSLVFARGQAYQAAGNPAITIDGTGYNAANCDFQHNTNSQAWGKLGTNTVAAGTIAVLADCTTGGSVGQAIEILGVTAPVTGRRRIMMVS